MAICGCRLPNGGYALEAGEARDAVCALGVQGRGGGCGGGAARVAVGGVVVVVRVRLAGVAIFDGCCGESGEGGCC